MKPLLVLLVFALLGICGCGSSSSGTDTTARDSSTAARTNTTSTGVAADVRAPTDYTKADSDKDNDVGAPYDDKQNGSVTDYGHAASAADAQAVTALITRYYAAALAENGAKACSMIITSLAEAVGEDYGKGSAGPSYLSTGTTCPTVMALLFKHYHSQLAVELPKLKVARVRLVGHRGLAVLSFGTMPEREIPVAREGRTWKLRSLLDSELP